MLECARIKNERLGLTGLLLHKGGNFMQMLAGEKETVLDLYETILQDPRHRDVMKVHADEIEVRNFPNWTMGFTDMETCEGLPEYGTLVQQSLLDRKFHEDSKFAYQFMLTFNELNN